MESQSHNSQEQLRRRKKTIIKAKQTSCTCFLVYFTVKAIVLLILYKYDNYLKHNLIMIFPFVFLLIANTYLMLTTGKDPGFEKNSDEDQESLMQAIQEIQKCKICNVKQRIRMKHCYRCDKCVRKYDHHCPWIGGCVGENNHAYFCLLLIMHTLQAANALYICVKSLDLYSYIIKNGSYSQEYGVFCIFAIFMTLYMCFAGGLAIFHFYLIAFNITTKQLMQRGKLKYLKGIKGNPFHQGFVKNIKSSMFPSQKGRDWVVEREGGVYQPNWIDKIWQNSYYNCC